MMSKTPRSRVKGYLRMMFLRSSERAAAIKRDKYCCQECGRKQTKAGDPEDWVKVEVHHKKGIKVWDEVIELIYREILCDPDDLQTLCKECHAAETHKERVKQKY